LIGEWQEVEDTPRQGLSGYKKGLKRDKVVKH